MPTIQGPITFSSGKELPKKMKDYIKANGIKTPFDPVGLEMTESKNDDWLRLKGSDGKLYKRGSNNRMSKVKKV